MAEQLRMEATVADNATGPLRRIREELAAFRETEGMKSLKESMGVLREQTSEFVKASAGAGNVMGGIGIGSLAASVSVGELIKTFKELADRASDLHALSKETGLTVDSINQLEHVAERFHVTPEKMATALGIFADKMVDFRRHTGDLFGELNQQAPDITKRLLGENPDQQIQEIFHFLDTIKNSGVRKRWAEAFFGDGDVARMVEDGYGKFAEAQAEAAKSVPKITAEYQRQAEEFHKSILDFNDSLERLETKVAPAVFKDLTQAAEKFSEAFSQIKDAWDWAKGIDKDHPLNVPDALGDVLKRQHEINEQRTKEGHGPIIDLPGEIMGQTRPSQGDIDAHRKFQEDRRSFGGSLFHKSSFEEFGNSASVGSGVGLLDVIQRGTRAGVLQGLQDYADMKTAASGAAGGGGGGGFQNAAFETGDPGSSAGGGSAGGSPGRGGSRSWRNNNPGNLEFGPFAKSMGATGSDGRYAIFPSYEAGRQAQEHLLFDSERYKGLTLGQAIQRYAPSSENNVPGYLRSLHANPNTRMGQFSPQQRSSLLDAMQAHEGWRVGSTETSGGGSGSASTAVDHAMKLIGGGINEAARGLGSRMSPGEWCADFVNGAFKSAGMHGVNSSMALAFRSWGHAVGLKDVKKGDVMLEDHGGGHGHAGLATGRVRRDANGNVVAVEEVSGNYGNRVRTNWEKPGRISDIRRGNERPSLWEAARGAGMLPGHQTVTHKGGADITIHGLPNGTSTRTKTDGLIDSVKLHRSTTMPDLSWT